ncbi:hypothetical protein ILUMI_14545 [Ignelater luminosus]|uniref:Uncharacterized protein n=1 Tax=Ignelater luminosus TaxID=2038154 RepID=A0A8K0GAU1_IGNLU|nr:hypothetical protein ILUMI_14545 [Ignelater luminosus]
MIIGKQEGKRNIKVDDKQLEQIDKFKYLRVIISKEGKLQDKRNERIAKTGKLHNSIKNNLLSGKEVPTNVKAEIEKKIVKPTLTYAWEEKLVRQNIYEAKEIGKREKGDQKRRGRKKCEKQQRKEDVKILATDRKKLKEMWKKTMENSTPI